MWNCSQALKKKQICLVNYIVFQDKTKDSGVSGHFNKPSPLKPAWLGTPIFIMNITRLTIRVEPETILLVNPYNIKDEGTTVPVKLQVECQCDSEIFTHVRVLDQEDFRDNFERYMSEATECIRKMIKESE